MKVLPVSEARSNFSSLLKEVEQGNEIGISHGHQKEIIAVIVPIKDYQKSKIRSLGTLEGKAKVSFRKNWKITDEEFINS